MPFDSGVPLTFKVGKRQIRCSYPTDEQFSAWIRAQRERDGRDVTGPAVSRDLLKRIQLDGDRLSESDARRVVNALQRSDITSVKEAGSRIEVRMDVVGGVETLHVVRMPLLDEVLRLRQNSFQRVCGARFVLAGPIAELYDRIHIAHDGYAGPVPIVHKAPVVAAAVERFAIMDAGPVVRGVA